MSSNNSGESFSSNWREKERKEGKKERKTKKKEADKKRGEGRIKK